MLMVYFSVSQLDSEWWLHNLKHLSIQLERYGELSSLQASLQGFSIALDPKEVDKRLPREF